MFHDNGTAGGGKGKCDIFQFHRGGTSLYVNYSHFSFWMKDKRIKEPLHLHVKDLQEN